MILELPYPPTVNSAYRMVKIGNSCRLLMSKRGREYRKRICDMMIGRDEPPVDMPMQMTIEIYPTDRRKRDMDNCMKSLLDALQHANVIADDSLIDELLIYRKEIFKGGWVTVRIEELNAA